MPRNHSRKRQHHALRKPSRSRCKHRNIDYGPARILDAAGVEHYVTARRCLDCKARLPLGRANDKPVKVELRAAAIAQDATILGRMDLTRSDTTKSEFSGWFDNGCGNTSVLTAGVPGYLARFAWGAPHTEGELVCSDLLAFLHQELDAEAEAFFRKHLAVCAKCQRALPASSELSTQLEADFAEPDAPQIEALPDILHCAQPLCRAEISSVWASDDGWMITAGEVRCPEHPPIPPVVVDGAELVEVPDIHDEPTHVDAPIIDPEGAQAEEDEP